MSIRLYIMVYEEPVDLHCHVVGMLEGSMDGEDKTRKKK